MKEENMAEVTRIQAPDAREKILSGKALLICAYEDDANFTRYHLEGAIPYSSFKKMVAELPKDQELIFYCH